MSEIHEETLQERKDMYLGVLANLDAGSEEAEEVQAYIDDIDEKLGLVANDGEAEESLLDEPAVDATPAAAELAEAEGVELSELEGSGADGRVVKADVEAAL